MKKVTDNLSLYARCWSRGVQPVFERLRGKATPRLEKELAVSEWVSRDEIEDRQWQELKKLLEHAKKTVPFYSRWFEKRGITVDEIVRKRDIGVLPLTSRDMMVADDSCYCSDEPPYGSYGKSTGGTTGAPFSFMVSPLSGHWRVAMTRRGYGWAGCVNGRRQAHIWSRDVMHVPLLRRCKRDLHRALMRQEYISSFEMNGPEDYDRVIGKLDLFKPDCIVGYATSTSLLAKRLLETGRSLSSQVRSFICAGEALFDVQRELIGQAFGCETFETYGNREFMLIAEECGAHDGQHTSSENLIVEVVDKEGRPVGCGQTGEVVVTDLYNYAQPFIRYRTGDISSFSDGDCRCGRTHKRLKRIEGRELDRITGPDGRQLTGHFLPHFVQEFPGIDRFQVVQDRPDHVVIRLVLSAPLADSDKQFIVSELEKTLPGVKAAVMEVSEIERTATGKMRTTVRLC